MSENYDNNGQYSRHGILRYEKIFGEGFVSSGGAEVARWMLERIALPAGARILDIGSGIGGTAFMMGEHFEDAEVLGIDLAADMVAISQERAAQKGNPKVSFQLADALKIELPEGHFDMIWSRDALLHIEDKKTLFQRCLGWLKPSGKLVISDYSQTKGPHSEAFTQYRESSGYFLHDVEAYGQILKDAGFGSVEIDDWTDRFVEVLRGEMRQLHEQRQDFLEVFTDQDLNYLLARWESKIGYCQNDDMRVGLWTALP